MGSMASEWHLAVGHHRPVIVLDNQCKADAVTTRTKDSSGGGEPGLGL